MVLKGLSQLPAKEINTLLFDLDGTIIDISKRAEILFYLRAFKRFKKYFNPMSFYVSFWKSLRSLQTHNTSRSNYDVFIEKMARYGRTTPQVMDLLASELVEKDFQSLGKFFKPVPGARETIDLAHERGYSLALVTNPVFPRKTVLCRMEWAGLRAENFLFITSSQDMSRCKPSVEFYESLLTRFNLKPEQCLMIGNTPVDDLPAHDAGIRTFLVETALSQKIVRKSIEDPRLDARGTYPDLMRWLKDGRQKLESSDDHE